MSRHIRKRNRRLAATFSYDTLECRKVLAGWSCPGLDTVNAVDAAPPAEISPSDPNTISESKSAMLSNQTGKSQNNNGNPGPVRMMDATIQSGHVYYNNTLFAQGTNGYLNAVDYYRLVARESDGNRTLDFRNMTNAAKGINAMMFNFDHLASSSLTAADFKFQWSPQSNFDVRLGQNLPVNWATVPFSPSEIVVSPNAGTLSRVRVHWLDNQIENRWLRVTVFANANTGLARDEVFYVGHLAGDISIPVATTNPGQPFGRFQVNNLPDVSFLRSRLGEAVFVSSTLDLNKNGYVEVDDVALVRSNLNRFLSNIQIGPPANLRYSANEDANDNSSKTKNSSLALWNSSNTVSSNERRELGTVQGQLVQAVLPVTAIGFQFIDQHFAEPANSQTLNNSLYSEPSSNHASGKRNKLVQTLGSNVQGLLVNPILIESASRSS